MLNDTQYKFRLETFKPRISPIKSMMEKKVFTFRSLALSMSILRIIIRLKDEQGD